MQNLAIICIVCITIAGVVDCYFKRKYIIKVATDTKARKALIEIVGKFQDKTLSSLGREIRDIALKGLE